RGAAERDVRLHDRAPFDEHRPRLVGDGAAEVRPGPDPGEERDPGRGGVNNPRYTRIGLASKAPATWLVAGACSWCPNPAPVESASWPFEDRAVVVHEQQAGFVDRTAARIGGAVDAEELPVVQVRDVGESPVVVHLA